MMRLGQRLVIATSMRFDPVLRADVTSSVKGGFQRISGSLCPFRVTSANSRTRPRSSRTLGARTIPSVRQGELIHIRRCSRKISHARIG